MMSKTPPPVKTKSVRVTCRWAKATILGSPFMSAMLFHQAVTIIFPRNSTTPRMWMHLSTRYVWSMVACRDTDDADQENYGIIVACSCDRYSTRHCLVSDYDCASTMSTPDCAGYLVALGMVALPEVRVPWSNCVSCLLNCTQLHSNLIFGLGRIQTAKASNPDSSVNRAAVPARSWSGDTPGASSLSA